MAHSILQQEFDPIQRELMTQNLHRGFPDKEDLCLIRFSLNLLAQTNRLLIDNQSIQTPTASRQ